MSNSTTSVLKSNTDAFAFDVSYVSSTGARNRIYWASTWVESESPNGRYEIERFGSRMWQVRHVQVIRHGDAKLTRMIGPATTKTNAIALAEKDSATLAGNVFKAMLLGHGVISA